MSRYRISLLLIGLFPISWCLILIAQKAPSFIETFYSTRFNQQWRMLLSQWTGFVPFSLFEMFVIVGIFCIFSYTIYFIYQLIRQPNQRGDLLLQVCLNVLATISCLYFIFISFWGLNYYRVPLEETLNLSIKPHSIEELTHLYEQLIELTNEARQFVLETENGVFTTTESPHQIFERASLGYMAASIDYPILSGDYGTPKPIQLSQWMSYTNITGIYSPFTAEANVNVNVPETTLLFTTLHEMAHQRGFANENEANFIAFLTCIYHPDSDFQYAGYLSALNYTRNALAKVDRNQVLSMNHLLSEGVKRDLSYQREFWAAYEGKVEQTFTNMNQTYLKLNGVTDGVQSYGRVVDLLFAYFERVNP